jgi:hypothetical protein
MRTPFSLAATVLTAAALAGCGGGSSGETSLPQGAEPVRLDPAGFREVIDHPYWPMSPGSRWVYRETDGEGSVQRVEVTVTDRTRSILGIEATVVHDVVTEAGRVLEDTWDWYAQDADGNVWYLGEATREFGDGAVSTRGSWEAGVDGAEAGILLPADPQVGMTYRQEHYAGEAEDTAAILGLDERAEVPAGAFDDVLLTRDTTPLDLRILEYKLYARGVGPVLVLGVSGGSGREELVAFHKGA